MKRSALRPVIATFIGLMVLIVLIEAGFITTAAIRKSAARALLRDEDSEFINKFSKLKDLELIRVIAIGESTTTPLIEEVIVDGSHHWQKVSWPEKFETKANQWLESRGFKQRVRVLNLGRSSTSSSFLVNQLKDQLETFHPDVVVSMTGINDTFRIEFDQSWLFRNSYLVRFLYWAKVAAKCANCYKMIDEISRQYSASPAELEAIEAGRVTLTIKPLNTAHEVANFRRSLRELQTRFAPNEKFMNLELAYWVFQQSQRPDIHNNSKRIGFRKTLLELAEELSLSSYDLMLKHTDAILPYCHVLSALERSCLELIKTALAEGLQPTAALIVTGNAHDGRYDSEFQRLLRGMGIKTQEGDYSWPITRNSYTQLGELANSENFSWFAMQYPTGEKAALITLLSDAPLEKIPYRDFADSFLIATPIGSLRPEFKNVLFVENVNFRTLVNEKNWADYYVDRWAKNQGLDFGHTTALGHQVIAENLLEVFIKNFNSVLKRKHDRD